MATYPVYFNESGLASGAQWSVNLSGTFRSSTTSSIVFSEPNGYYGYLVASSGSKYPNPSSGNFSVNGSGVGVTIRFAALFAVTFTESGLPNGTGWNVTLGNFTQSHATTSFVFSVPNGSYAFSVGGVGSYAPNPSRGSVAVSGSNANVSVTFRQAPTFTITFNESGLPTSTYWVVDLGGFSGTAYTSNGTTMTFGEPNGTYAFYAYSPGYLANPKSTTVQVSGANVRVAVPFHPQLYLVVEERGLAPGTTWGIVLKTSNSSTQYPLRTDNASIPVANGTYNYSFVPVNGYRVNVSTGTVTVAGASVTLRAGYGLVAGYYALSVDETGLPNGVNWTASFNGPGVSVTVVSVLSAASYAVPNGTYGYGPLNLSGYTVNPSYGQLTVAGANASVNVTFRTIPPTTYRVTFIETGLPNGTNWTVTVGGPGGWMTNYTSFSNLSFAETNGTYRWVASATVHGIGLNQTGTILVLGNRITVQVGFANLTSTYPVVFSETGLPAQLNWTVVLGGSQHSSWYNGSTHSTVFAFWEFNGSYSYSVPKVGAYTPSPGSGNVTVSGARIDVNVSFANSTTRSFSAKFVESGLPSGTNWSVDLNGLTRTTATTILTFSEGNGSYPWYAAATVNGTSVNASGVVRVNGANVSVNATFLVPSALVAVTFQEYGLTGRTNWSLTLTAASQGLTIETAGVVMRWSDGAETVVFHLSSGSYSYTSAASGYRSSPSSLEVSGMPLIVPIHFGPKGGGSTTNGTGVLLTGWAAGVGVALLVIGASGLGMTVLRSRARQRQRGERLVARLAETEWVRDENGEPTLRRAP